MSFLKRGRERSGVPATGKSPWCIPSLNHRSRRDVSTGSERVPIPMSTHVTSQPPPTTSTDFQRVPYADGPIPLSSRVCCGKIFGEQVFARNVAVWWAWVRMATSPRGVGSDGERNKIRTSRLLKYDRGCIGRANAVRTATGHTAWVVCLLDAFDQCLDHDLGAETLPFLPFHVGHEVLIGQIEPRPLSNVVNQLGPFRVVPSCRISSTVRTRHDAISLLSWTLYSMRSMSDSHIFAIV